MNEIHLYFEFMGNFSSTIFTWIARERNWRDNEVEVETIENHQESDEEEVHTS